MKNYLLINEINGVTEYYTLQAETPGQAASKMMYEEITNGADINSETVAIYELTSGINLIGDILK